MAESENSNSTVTADTERIIATDNTRRTAVALTALRDAILQLPTKKIGILADWIVKWGTLLRKEIKYKPEKVSAYKQREIVLVEFGFNVDGEFGGRHYAVVLEKNNNPKSSVILVAPITSYDSTNGKYNNPNNVDLGVGFIHNTDKGAAVVINQIRNISKMRIEPLTNKSNRIYVDKVKFQEILTKLYAHLS